MTSGRTGLLGDVFEREPDASDLSYPDSISIVVLARDLLKDRQ